MNIVIVDDELGLRHTLTLILEGDGHETRAAGDGEAALALLAERDADLVLCDVRMPTLDGIGFLERYRRASGKALVIMMSAYGDDEAALDAIKRGAHDFIQKPFRADQVLLVVRKAIEREGLREQVRRLSAELDALRAPVDGAGDGIVGRSVELDRALTVARKVARHPSSVLITGESGTGKELFARLIHRESPRANAPFVAVNCGAIPEALLESELFGHTKGAFTGATEARAGLFEEADGGTLFLDEIGELPLALQVKLLRALQEDEIRRVGDSAARRVDVRLVAATARDLEAEVRAGRFRADLFYRINVVRVHLPPLRERREDISLLTHHFLQRFNRRLGLHITGVAPAAMKLLLEHPWPGNVRELENVIERAMVLADDHTIAVEHLPASVRDPASVAPPPDDQDLSVKRRIESLERALIARALERTGGNRTRAAKLLDLSHRALLYKIKEYGLG
jgi:two-component system response regulator AtoC